MAGEGGARGPGATAREAGARAGARRARRACALAGVALLAAFGIGAPAALAGTTRVAPLTFLHVSPAAAGPARLHQIVDANGRSVLLRGVNLTGLRDDYVADGTLRPPYPETPTAYDDGACPSNDTGVYMAPVCAEDAGQLASFGYDAVRLPVSWSLLEPEPGAINTAYVDRIAQVVGWLKARGIYTIIDMHQDAWSKYLSTPAGTSCPPTTDPITGFHEADGAPAWASVHIAPVCAEHGVRDLDAAVQEDFQRFYADIPGPDGVGLQEHYGAVLAALARRFARDPAVAGYELLNEPEPGFVAPPAMDAGELFPLYAKLIGIVRRAVPDFRQLVFIEPDVTRDILDRSGVLEPWSLYSSYRNVVYAPHIYTGVFTLDAELGASQLGVLYPPNGGYDSAVSDARALGLPLWVGEFGNSVAQDPTLLARQYANQDRLAVGGALWYWKGFANEDGHWSVLYDDAAHSDAAYPSRVLYTDRAYPVATFGTLTRLSYDPAHAAVRLRARAPRRVRPGDLRHATIVYLPAAETGRVRVTGAAVRVVAAPGGAREAEVFPRRGAYQLSVN